MFYAPLPPPAPPAAVKTDPKTWSDLTFTGKALFVSSPKLPEIYRKDPVFSCRVILAAAPLQWAHFDPTRTVTYEGSDASLACYPDGRAVITERGK